MRMRALRMIAMALSLLAAPAFAQQSGSPAPSEEFGIEVNLSAKTIVALSGSAKWDTAFESVVEAFKTVQSYLDREGVKPAGSPMLIYTSADDAGFEFQAALPIGEPLKNPPKGDIAMGQSPAGRAYKFVHRGSYDRMDNIYEAITNFLDQKNLDAQDTFIEEYVTDPRTTPEDKLVINIYVPIK